MQQDFYGDQRFLFSSLRSYRIHKFENSVDSFFWRVIVIFEFSMISNHWEDSFYNLQHFVASNWTIIIQIVKSESPWKVSFKIKMLNYSDI